MTKNFLIILIFLFSKASTSQIPEINARKTATYSAILPGAGQILNKKLWKIPIIYSCLGTCLYYALDNQKKYLKYKVEYLDRQNGAESNSNLINYSDQDLIVLKDNYRRNRDISYLFLAVSYLLNIIDASVDRHFMSYDVSNDLSLSINQNQRNISLKIYLNLN